MENDIFVGGDAEGEERHVVEGLVEIVLFDTEESLFEGRAGEITVGEV